MPSHVQARTLSGFGPSFTPHAEHTRDVGSNRPAFPKVRPCLAALYSSIAVNVDQPASCTDLASRVRPSPATHRSSTYTAWLSRMIRVDFLCSQSRRASATWACTRATLTRALSRLLLPWSLRTGPAAPCGACAPRGAGTSGWRPSVPSDRTAKWVSPRSMPISVPVSGSGSSRPGPRRRRSTAGRVQDHGDRRGLGRQVAGPADRDIANLRQPQLPAGMMVNRALRVNRIACRRSLRDRNRGGATLALSACR